MKDPIEQLTSIQRVEVSPFLYSRILRSIENKVLTIDKQEVVYWAIPCLVIIILTIFIINAPVSHHQLSVDLIQSMHLESVNTLY